MTGPGDSDEDLDLAWPLEPRDEADMWPKERRLRRRRNKKKEQGAPAEPSLAAPDLGPEEAEGLPADRTGLEPEAADVTGQTDQPSIGADPAPEAPAEPAAASSPPPPASMPAATGPSSGTELGDESRYEDMDPTPPPQQVIETAAVAEPTPRARARYAVGTPGDSIDMNRLRAVQDEATVEILDAVNSVDESVSRVERVASALASEMAEIAQALTDETAAQATATQAALRAGTAQLSADIEALGETVADAIAGIEIAGGAGSGGGGAGFEGRILTQLAEASDRVEALLEDLVAAAEGRPLDPGELTARTAERFAEAMAGRVQAATADAVSAIDDAVDRAVDRASEQIRQLANPQANRSMTYALERLEERVSTISRQREEDALDTRQAFEAIGSALAHMSSVHADDLERLRAAVEASRQPRPGEQEDERVAKLADAIEAIANLPGTTDELVSVISEQTEVLNTELEAVRRRLALRARTTLDQASLEHLADLVAARLRE